MPEEATPVNPAVPVTPVVPEQNISERVLKIKMENDALEAELSRQENLKARLELGGRALAGQRDKTPEEEAKEEATKMLKLFGR